MDEEIRPAEELGSLAERGMTSISWSGGSHAVQTIILLARSIILARLLDPVTFGLYALPQSIVILTSIFPTFGMDLAYVNRTSETADRRALSVQFSLVIGLLVVWLLAMFGVGWALFTGTQRWVLYSLACVIAIGKLTLPACSDLARRVQLRRLAILNMVSTVVGSVLSVALATMGAGVWSLVAIDAVLSIVMVVGLLVFHPVWTPSVAWSQSIASYFFRFGGTRFAASFLDQFLDRFDEVWTGIYVGSASLGFYWRAYGYASYPKKLLLPPTATTLGGVYAEAKDDPAVLSKIYDLAVWAVIRASFLLAGGMFVVSREFILILLGPEWLPMLSTFRIMLLYAMLDAGHYTLSGIFPPIGRPEVQLRVKALQAIVFTMLLYSLGSMLGIEGVALTTGLIAMLGTVQYLWRARGIVRLHIRQWFMIPMICLAAGILGAEAVGRELATSPLVWEALAKGAGYLILFVGLLILLEGGRLKARTLQLVGLIRS